VVSAVERHTRQLTIRVTVQDIDGIRLRATSERDVAADMKDMRRGALPINADVEHFLQLAKTRLNPKLLEGKPYKVTEDVRKALEYWYVDHDRATVRFKIHFGGYQRSAWSPIEVGLYLESETSRDVWRARVEEALRAGRLPIETKVVERGKQTLTALKDYLWTAPAELTDELLTDVTDTLLRFEEVLGVPVKP